MSHKDEVRLLPYTVEEVQDKSTEVPYGVRMVEAPGLWESGIKGDGTVIAILDTGCELNHPDLKNQIIGGRNFTTDDGGDPNNFNDTNGHGTHVAGTIAASLNNAGVVGVAPNAKLLICKVLTGSGSGAYDWIIRAIDYAVNWRGPQGERVRIINMSLGGPSDVPGLHAAVKSAVDNNIAVVCAAGNEGDNNETSFEYSYPGAYNEVIEVGAIDQLQKKAYFTNENLEVDVVGPGVDILSTYLNGQYAKLSGTSMATPHISGALALLAQYNDKAFNRFLTEPELYAQLVKNTVSLGYRKSTEGNGLVKLNMMEKVNSLIHFIKSL